MFIIHVTRDRGKIKKSGKTIQRQKLMERRCDKLSSKSSIIVNGTSELKQSAITLLSTTLPRLHVSSTIGVLPNDVIRYIVELFIALSSNLVYINIKDATYCINVDTLCCSLVVEHEEDSRLLFIGNRWMRKLYSGVPPPIIPIDSTELQTWTHIDKGIRHTDNQTAVGLSVLRNTTLCKIPTYYNVIVTKYDGTRYIMYTTGGCAMNIVMVKFDDDGLSEKTMDIQLEYDRVCITGYLGDGIIYFLNGDSGKENTLIYVIDMEKQIVLQKKMIPYPVRLIGSLNRTTIYIHSACVRNEFTTTFMDVHTGIEGKGTFYLYNWNTVVENTICGNSQKRSATLYWYKLSDDNEFCIIENQIGMLRFDVISRLFIKEEIIFIKRVARTGVFDMISYVVVATRGAIVILQISHTDSSSELRELVRVPYLREDNEHYSEVFVVDWVHGGWRNNIRVSSRSQRPYVCKGAPRYCDGSIWIFFVRNAEPCPIIECKQRTVTYGPYRYDMIEHDAVLLKIDIHTKEVNALVFDSLKYREMCSIRFMNIL